jgi:transposase-like protein
MKLNNTDRITKSTLEGSFMLKYSYEEKMKACENYFSGKRLATQVANDIGLTMIFGAINTWFRLYQEHGSEAFIQRYEAEISQSLLLQYLLILYNFLKL